MKRYILSALALLMLGACATTATPPSGSAPPGAISSTGTPITLGIAPEDVARIDALLTQTRDLLLLAPDVARIQWNAKRPVENRKSDAAIVDHAASEAPKYKADPGLFRDYFLALVEASRFVRIELTKQWKTANAPATMTLTRSVAQVQGASDAITPTLMQALADVAPVLKIPGARGVVETRAKDIMPTKSALSDPTRAIAVRPLLERAAP